MKTSPHGYEYIQHTNTGGDLPQPGEIVYFHAQIRNGDSVVYMTRQESEEPPFLQIQAEPAPNTPPSPIEDVLRLIAEGDSVTIFVPLDSFPQRPRGFESADQIIYDVTLVEIQAESDFQAEQQKLMEEAAAEAAEVGARVSEIVSQYNSGQLKDQIQVTESGLKYVILEEGSGPYPVQGSGVVVNYYGVLPDGTEFDNSFKRGQPFTFPLGVGQVIQGWDEGIALLNKGAKAALFIPSELGYGKAGSPPVIPPDSELVFYVELVDIK